MLTLITLGDSILDSGAYNAHGLTPGELLMKNDDGLFPEFRGRDLSSAGPVRLDHRAVDGARVSDLLRQSRDLRVEGPAIAILTIGGNDLLGGLASDDGPGIDTFARTLEYSLDLMRVRPVLLGTVYDPTFGDDSRNFLGIDPSLARANHRRVNQEIAEIASRYGLLVDLHAHFLTGDPSWFTMTIEPSLRGTSEVRRCFLEAIERYTVGSSLRDPLQ